MASNLPGNGVCIGEHSVCIIRIAKLDTDCSPLGGADSGVVTDAIVTMTADVDLEEGTTFEPKLGCGTIGFTVEEPDVIKRYNLSGELLYHSPEVEHVLFGGRVIVGTAASDFNTDNIGWAAPRITDAASNGVYLEVITKTAARGVGACSVGGVLTPYAVGHVFGRVKATPGSMTFENDVRNLTFTAKASQNPALFNGPWNDFPGSIGGAPYLDESAYQWFYYSADEYNAIAALASCGYQTLSAGS